MSDRLVGFGVRKTPKTKRVVYFVRRVLGGKDHRLTIGRGHQLSVRAARKIAALRLLEIEQAAGEPLPPSRVLPAPAPDPRIDEILTLVRPSVQPERASLTVGELWERVSPGWLARVKPATRKDIVTVFQSRILPQWSSTPVDQIQTGNLTKWYHSFLDTSPHYGASATRKLLCLLRLGHEQGFVASLPEFKVRFVAPKRRQPMEQDAVCALVEALEGVLRDNGSHVYANAIIALLNTGERARAGSQLHTREVNYDDMCITKERKRGLVKKIPMSSYTASFLRSIHPEGGGYYFPNLREPSQPIKYSTLLSFLKRLCSQNGIQARDGSTPTLHSLRHTYATLLEERGLPVSHIQRLLGHSSMKSTLRYIHGSESAARAGADRLEVTRVRVPTRES